MVWTAGAVVKGCLQAVLAWDTVPQSRLFDHGWTQVSAQLHRCSDFGIVPNPF